MAEIVITKEMVESAKAYLPLADKEKFLQDFGRTCFDRLEMAGESGESLPPMYKENPMIKARLFMSALAGLYFGQEYDEEIPGVMARAEYDLWAGSHVFGQLERLKKTEPGLKGKIFDILEDYADLQKRFNAEMFGYINALNDPVTRLMDYMATTATPEYMQNLTAQLTKAQADLEDYAANRDKIMAEMLAQPDDEEENNGAISTV